MFRDEKIHQERGEERMKEHISYRLRENGFKWKNIDIDIIEPEQFY